MKKVLIIAALVAAPFASMSHAASFNNSCGPTAETYAEVGEENNRGHNDFRVGFKLKWTLGAAHKKNCEAYNTSVTDKARQDHLTTSAKRKQEEADLLQQRIRICSDFEFDTAPSSIQNFCGDLLK